MKRLSKYIILLDLGPHILLCRRVCFSDELASSSQFFSFCRLLFLDHTSIVDRFMVVKRFKTALNKDVREVHKRDRYLAQMEVQSVAAQMAEEFNNR